MTPLYGRSSHPLIAIAALVVNVERVPLAITLVNAGQAAGDGADGGSGKGGGPVLSTVLGSLKPPVVVTPVVALVLVLAGVTLPEYVETSVKLIGSAGVAVCVSELTLAAHKLKLDRDLILNTLGKLVVLPLWILLLPRS